MRLIDAELLKHEMITESVRPLLARRNVLQIIDDAPTIGAEPVRRGRWREHKSKDWSGGGAYICSVCGYGYSWAGYHEANEFTYCPNCGARMEAEI